MKPTIHPFLVAISMSLVILTSCLNDVDLTNISGEIQWKGALAAPIGTANLKLEDLVAQLDSQKILTASGEEFLYQDSDNVEFQFRQINLIQNALPLNKSLYVSPETTITIPANTQIPTISSDENIQLGINSSQDERIDSVKISSAVLSVKVTVDNLSVNPNNVKFTLDFPLSKVKHYDGSLVEAVYTPSSFNQAQNIALSNFTINTSDSGSSIPITLKLDITTGNLPVRVSPSSKVNIELKLTSMQFDVAYGYFAPSSIASKVVQQSLNLPDFTKDGAFKFADPKIFITVQSNIGTYLKFDINYAKAYQKSNPSQAVYASFNGNQSTSESMGIKPSAPGIWVTKQLTTLDKNYGTIDKLFDTSNKADTIEMKYGGNVDNDKISTDPTPNFITPDAAIKVKYKIQIPLYLKPTSYYIFKDTIKNAGKDIDSVLNKVKINTLSIYLTVMNGLPVKGTLSMQLNDASGHKINTTFISDYQINAPDIDSNGYVKANGITPQKIEIKIDSTQVDDFRRTKDIVFQFRIDSKDASSFIHFRKSDTFNVKAGLFVNGSN